MILKDWLDKKYTKEEQKKLKMLNCSSQEITSLEGIKNLTKLEKLWCFNNELTSLKGIENLTKLEVLNCSYNTLPSKYENKSFKEIQRMLKIEKRKEFIKSIL